MLGVWGVDSTNLYLVLFHFLSLVAHLFLGQGSDKEDHGQPVHQDHGHNVVSRSLLVIILNLQMNKEKK